MRGLILAASAAVVAACGQSAPEAYPPQYELNFMRACQAQQATGEFCACTWDKIERELPADEFAAFERLPAKEQETHSLRTRIERFADECRTELIEPPAEPPAP